MEYCFPSLLKQAQWLFHRDNQYILPLSEGNQSPEYIGHLTGRPHFHPSHQELHSEWQPQWLQLPSNEFIRIDYLIYV